MLRRNLDLVGFDEGTYRNRDSVQQQLGRRIPAARNAIVLISRESDELSYDRSSFSGWRSRKDDAVTAEFHMAYDDDVRTHPAFTRASPLAEQTATFLRAVYGWMCVGLAVTAVTAWGVSSTPAFVVAVATNRILFWGLMLAQLGLVIVLSARVDRLAPATAAVLFVAYSALTGVTISFVLLAFTGESVAATFVVTAGMFGALALYGTVTRRDVSGLGQFLFMGLVGIVIAGIVNVFWQNDAFQFVLSFIGVIVFTGLTVYDAQRLKSMALAMPAGETGSYSIVGALTLYLDFINLFLMLLRLFGNRRD